MLPNHRFGHPGCLVKITEVRPQVVVLVERRFVALEGCVIGGVKTNQGWEQPDGRERQPIPDEVSLIGQHLIPMIQRLEHIRHRVVVRCL